MVARGSSAQARRAWSADFDAWAAEALARGDVEVLRLPGEGAGMPYAHPTVDHYIPLFITLGAATDPQTKPLPRSRGTRWRTVAAVLEVD